MDVKSQIKSLFKEAELYRSQGLLAEAREKYAAVAVLLRDNKELASRKYLLEELSKKISAVDERIEVVKDVSRTPELPSRIQDLIKNLFSFSEKEDSEAAELEGAIALAKFGQFDRAIVEFNKLVKKDALRIVAAKNILRCQIALEDYDNAFNQFEQWRSSVDFSSEDLEKVRVFLQDILNKKGVEKTLAAVAEAAAMQEDEPFAEELLDIVSIGVTLEHGPKKGKFVEVDVNFQKGNTITLMVPGNDSDLIENMKIGAKLGDVQFSSPFAVFSGSGIVAAMTKIDSGPKQGDYMVDIKIQSS